MVALCFELDFVVTPFTDLDWISRDQMCYPWWKEPIMGRALGGVASGLLECEIDELLILSLKYHLLIDNLT
jgi:hypothetical protein